MLLPVLKKNRILFVKMWERKGSVVVFRIGKLCHQPPASFAAAPMLLPLGNFHEVFLLFPLFFLGSALLLFAIRLIAASCVSVTRKCAYFFAERENSQIIFPPPHIRYICFFFLRENSAKGRTSKKYIFLKKTLGKPGVCLKNSSVQG